MNASLIHSFADNFPVNIVPFPHCFEHKFELNIGGKFVLIPHDFCTVLDALGVGWEIPDAFVVEHLLLLLHFLISGGF